ncbi:tail fiber protein [Sporosarcina sp. Te-1]|uniref:tail fiber protein n=1 Tax=Sporosarcina sp. Te-1 TaxID=2818390 RepID=UPI001A9DF395|nr:tail fiber protein [Sporosarcina sp. Te-1]QTD41539.1 tail fiber protein [Sporosarcina sp. Te-1]
MTEEFGFFDPVEVAPEVFDREYNAQQFTNYFKALITTGILKGAGKELKVTANDSNMITEIDTGIAFIEGRYYSNTSQLAHTHETETLGKDRIDRVVVQLNLDDRLVKTYIKKGIASATPIAPALTRNKTIYEISLAQVKVIGGQTYIKTDNVRDERGDKALCPYAGSEILPNFNDAILANLVEQVESLFRLVQDDDKGSAFELETGTNLNTLTKSGFYRVGYSTSPISGLPAGTYMIMVVRNKTVSPEGNSPVIQMFIGENVELGKIFVRIRNSIGVWSVVKTVGGDVSDASLTHKGIVQLTNSFTSTSQALALTQYAGYTLNNAINTLSNKLLSSQLALGQGASASGSASTAVGTSSKATGTYAAAYGLGANAGTYSTALGALTDASQTGSVALGYQAHASMYSDGKLGVGINATGPWNWLIPGQLHVAGSKNFQIPHPKPLKKETHIIRHGAVESPTAGDTLYRYSVDIVDDIAIIKMNGMNDTFTAPIERADDTYVIRIALPDYWIYLNIHDQVFVSPSRHFGMGFGEIDWEAEQLILTLQSRKSYHVLLLGTRNDDDVQIWHVKGIERELGETWLGETYVIDDLELDETTELEEEI